MGSKPWFLSRGVVGAAVALVLALLQIDMDVETREALTDNVVMIAIAASSLMALIGRWRAKKKLTLK